MSKGRHGPLGRYADGDLTEEARKAKERDHLERCNQCREAEGLPLVQISATATLVEWYDTLYEVTAALAHHAVHVNDEASRKKFHMFLLTVMTQVQDRPSASHIDKLERELGAARETIQKIQHLITWSGRA